MSAAPEPIADDRLYEPAEGELQLTARALVVGCIVGCLVCAMNTYVGLRIGWSFGGSIIAAIVSFSIFSALKPERPFTVLETNVGQTAGSAAGAMAACGGFLAPIPAMSMLGHELGFVDLILWSIATAFLGVFFAVPLRRQMVVVEKLRFPSGTATAETILAMFQGKNDAVGKARVLLWSAVIAGGLTLLMFFVPPLEHPIKGLLLGTGLAFLIERTIDFLFSPVMLGAGILIGVRVGASLALGAIVAWAFVGPMAQEAGWAPGKFMAYKDGARGWILWPGVAIMVADALTSLLLSWRTILNTFKRSGDASTSGVDDPAQAIPNSWWIGGLAISSVATSVICNIVFGIAVPMTLLAIAMSSILAMIAVRSTGETDINPIGGMGKVTQLVYGGIAPGQMATNLMCAAVTGAGATQAGDMMHDLKTGYLLRASPRRQFIAQCVGIVAGIFVCVPVYKLFESAYEIGGEKIPAPAAHAWKAMAELLSQGLDALPPHALTAVAIGAAFGAAMPILRKLVPAVAAYTPSGLAVGIAFIVPAYYSLAMFIGSVLFMFWQKKNPDAAERYGFAIASGLLAGEGLIGIVNAGLTIMGVEPLVK